MVFDEASLRVLFIRHEILKRTHQSAQYNYIPGHTRVVQLLLNRGALLHRDHNGRNPLMLAAMSGYTQTIELLHSVHSHLLDQVDKDGVSLESSDEEERQKPLNSVLLELTQR